MTVPTTTTNEACTGKKAHDGTNDNDKWSMHWQKGTWRYQRQRQMKHALAKRHMTVPTTTTNEARTGKKAHDGTNDNDKWSTHWQKGTWRYQRQRQMKHALAKRHMTVPTTTTNEARTGKKAHDGTNDNDKWDTHWQKGTWRYQRQRQMKHALAKRHMTVPTTTTNEARTGKKAHDGTNDNDKWSTHWQKGTWRYQRQRQMRHALEKRHSYNGFIAFSKMICRFGNMLLIS